MSLRVATSYEELHVKGGKYYGKIRNLSNSVDSLANRNEHTGVIHKDEKDEDRYIGTYRLSSKLLSQRTSCGLETSTDDLRWFDTGERAKYLTLKNTSIRRGAFFFLPFRMKEFSITSS